MSPTLRSQPVYCVIDLLASSVLKILFWTLECVIYAALRHVTNVLGCYSVNISDNYKNSLEIVFLNERLSRRIVENCFRLVIMLMNSTSKQNFDNWINISLIECHLYINGWNLSSLFSLRLHLILANSVFKFFKVQYLNKIKLKIKWPS